MVRNSFRSEAEPLSTSYLEYDSCFLPHITVDGFCFAGWINYFHPACKDDRRHYVTSEMLIAGFSKRLTYLRRKMDEPGEGSSGNRDCPKDLVFEDTVDYD